MKIKSMFTKQTEFWTEQNINFFGIEPREWSMMSPNEIEDALKQDSDKYWNSENKCEMAELVHNGTICRDNDKIVPGSVTLKMNVISGCVDIFADFKVRNEVKKDVLIASVPSPCPDLTWVINKNKYTPRISAFRDYNMVNSDGKVVRHNGVWSYDLKTKEFTIYKKRGTDEPITDDPFSTLNKRSIIFLETCIGEKLTRDNFEYALSKIPKIDRTSVFAYEFTHLDLFFDLVRSGTRFANPLKNIQLGVNTIFMKQNHSFDVSDKLVASRSPIFSLENFRTVVYKPAPSGATGYIPSFAFTDTIGLFDAFKTTTSNAAGRHRLLLDNVYVKDGLLYVVDKEGVSHNMFEILFGKFTNNSNISVISSSLFCNNNDPKRIMMTSKLSAQAVPVKGQEDIFTNRVKARVVFGDFEGWTFADSILISESFAKKLESTKRLEVDIRPKSKLYDLRERKGIGDEVTLEELKIMFPTVSIPILKNYEKVVIKNIEETSPTSYRVIMSATIPFGLGDKITNLHGSKGVVGKIIPDDEMPRLKHDIGDFKAGPFEVIISGFSVLRRGSMGQIFEAWANASGIEFEMGQDFASLAIKKYKDQMREFSKQCVVEFQGEETIKPCGIIDIIRLYHHASTKTSLSYLKSNSGKMLNLGNMEKLNLVATGRFDILKELSIRSTRKHDNALWLIHQMMTHGKLPSKARISSNFARILKSAGLSMKIDGEELVKSDIDKNIISKEYAQQISEVSNEDPIDLDKLYGGLESEQIGQD